MKGVSAPQGSSLLDKPWKTKCSPPLQRVPSLPQLLMDGLLGQGRNSSGRSVMKPWVYRWLKKVDKAGLKSESHLGSSWARVAKPVLFTLSKF